MAKANPKKQRTKKQKSPVPTEPSTSGTQMRSASRPVMNISTVDRQTSRQDTTGIAQRSKSRSRSHDRSQTDHTIHDDTIGPCHTSGHTKRHDGVGHSRGHDARDDAVVVGPVICDVVAGVGHTQGHAVCDDTVVVGPVIRDVVVGVGQTRDLEIHGMVVTAGHGNHGTIQGADHVTRNSVVAQEVENVIVLCLVRVTIRGRIDIAHQVIPVDPVSPYILMTITIRK